MHILFLLLIAQQQFYDCQQFYEDCIPDYAPTLYEILPSLEEEFDDDPVIPAEEGQEDYETT